LKILLTHHRYHSNLFNWFRGFQANGHEVKLLVYKPDEVKEKGLPESVCLKPSRYSKWQMNRNQRTRGDGVDSFSPYYFPSFKELWKVFRQNKPEVVIIRPAFTLFGYQTLLLALIFRAKIVFHSRIHIHRYYTPWKKYIFIVLMGVFGSYWMSPCNGDPKKYPNIPKRLVNLPFMIQAKFKSRDYFRGEQINLLCVAKYFKSKNPLMMLEVFFELRKKHSGIRLTICGTGDELGEYYSNIKKLRHESGFSGDIDILINQPPSMMDQLYRSHDVFILPTNHDPASFTVLEAMSYGLSTITTDIDGSAGYISRGENGYIVEKGNKDQLIGFLDHLIDNKELIKKQGEQSLRMVEKNHESKRHTSKFLKKILR